MAVEGDVAHGLVLHKVLEPLVEVGEAAEKGLDERYELVARYDALVEEGEYLEEVLVDLLRAEDGLGDLEKGGLVQVRAGRDQRTTRRRRRRCCGRR